MRLSMHILADRLAEYHPVCSIKKGNRSIRNVRLFSDGLEILANNVYVGRTSGDSGKVICIHENDYMILDCDDEIQIMNEIMDAFDFYNGWSDQINHQIEHVSLDEILEMSHPVLHSGLMVTDASYYILGMHLSQQLKQDPVLQQAKITHIMDMQHILNVEKDQQIRRHSSHSYIQETGGFTQQAYVRNLFANQLHWGWVISICDAHTKGQMDVVDELGDILELWMSHHPDLLEHAEQSSAFLHLMEEPQANQQLIETQLRLIHWNFGKDTYAYYVSPEEFAHAFIHKIRQLSPSVYTYIYQNHLIFLFQGSPKEKNHFEAKLLKATKGSDFSCGISPVFHDIYRLREFVDLAQIAAEYATYDSAPCKDFAAIALNHSIDLLRKQCGTWLPHPAVSLLEQYDTENHTDFSQTLYMYLCCERNIARLCRRSGLHRNTLLYRIDRIQELLQLDLDDDDTRLHLLLSYKIQDSHSHSAIK